MAKNQTVLYGRNSVFERLKADPQSIRKIFLQDNLKVPQIEKLIRQNNLPAERLSSKALERIKHAKDLQGIIAKVDGFQYTLFEDLLRRKREEDATIIFLDRISDPQNLGVIMRTAACFGRMALVIPEHRACGVNETVLHVASGGENYISVSIVANMANALTAAKEAGYWIAGTVVSAGVEEISKVSLPFPVGLVMGSEGEGIRQGLLKHLDIKVRIPMEGAKLSFNVSMACAIFCYEISKRRRELR
ncbi:MAG: 23S rRNA (guanosine(2251)-2'-O)-methyltransferase RlmB [Candidatus Omnitrophica bacterium]|nr:23S rRNA (guanosine(2251)-2'-O)-methyltransferase RlmB [Candidatus Omnitrophota bacterium]